MLLTHTHAWQKAHHYVLTMLLHVGDRHASPALTSKTLERILGNINHTGTTLA